MLKVGIILSEINLGLTLIFQTKQLASLDSPGTYTAGALRCIILMANQNNHFLQL